MFRPLVAAIAAFGLTLPAAAAEPARAPSHAARADQLAGHNDRVLTYVLIAALIGGIVVATIVNTSKGKTPASP